MVVMLGSVQSIGAVSLKAKRLYAVVGCKILAGVGFLAGFISARPRISWSDKFKVKINN